jgi:hypothetical protein
VLLQTNNTEMNEAIVKELLQSTQHLKYIYMQPVGDKLAQLVPANNEMLFGIHKQVQHSHKQHIWQKYKPFVIAIVTLGLCIVMYLYSKR